MNLIIAQLDITFYVWIKITAETPTYKLNLFSFLPLLLLLGVLGFWGFGRWNTSGDMRLKEIGHF